MVTVPTLLTFLRLILVVPLTWAITIHEWELAFILFIFAAITDVLDGYLARRLHQETFFGACFDPVADKILTIGCYTTLVLEAGDTYLPLWFFYLILGKELLLIVGALLFGLLQNTVTIRPNYWGKGAMVVQSMMLALIFAQRLAGSWFLTLNVTLLSIATVFIVVSFVTYSYQLYYALIRNVSYE